MVRGRRLGGIGLASLLGVALGLGMPGCSRKPTQEANKKGSATGFDDGVKTMRPGGSRPSVTPRVTALRRGSGASHGTLAPGALGTPSASMLYAQARDAWLAGECEKAIRLARQANRIKFSTRHVSIIGACACSLRRPATAKWAYKILKGGQRNMLIQVCRMKGIDITSSGSGSGSATSAPQPSSGSQRPVPSAPSVPSASSATKSAQDLYLSARKAWLAGQCSKATRLAKLANSKKSSPKHWSIIGACACSLRRRAQAKRALVELQGAQRTMLIANCRTKGIHLE